MREESKTRERKLKYLKTVTMVRQMEISFNRGINAAGYLKNNGALVAWQRLTFLYLTIYRY